LPTQLRVVIVLSYGAMGGAESWLLDLLDATPRLRVDAVLLGAGPMEQELAARGIPHHVVPAGRRPAALIAPAVRIARLLRRSRPDLVLGNGFKGGLVAGAAGRLAGVRTAWVKHDHSFDGRLTGLVSGLCDGVIATSNALAAESRHPGVRVIPPPRHAAPVAGRAEARRLLRERGIDLDGHLVMAMVGRLVPYKGCEDAIRALGETPAGPWRLLVIGESDTSAPHERQRLAALAKTVGVADRVHFAGAIPTARTLFRAFDALAVLTRRAGAGPDREGFGITALEAMTAGVPVLAVEPSPIADWIRDRAALIVPPAAPAQLAAALARLADPALRRSLGDRGAELAAAHPDPADCAQEFVAHLAAVACRPGAGLLGGQPISIVVTVLNEEGAIDALLETLRAQLRLRGDEVVVVDGGSTDGTVGRVARHARHESRIRLVSSPGAGISTGRNVGVRAAANDLIACTDAGCRPRPEWLEALRSAGAERDPADLLTGVYRVSNRGVLQAAAAAVGYPDPDELRHPSLLVRGYGRLLGRTFDPTMPTGRSMAFSRAAWRRVGGFPEHLQTGEDVLFGRAVADGGRAVLVADAEVAWDQRATLVATATMYFRYGMGSGVSRNPRLMARDLARASAGGLLPVLLRHPGGRVMAGLAAAAYLSLPLARLRHHPDRLRVAAVVPLVAAVRDLAKAAGCLRGLLEPAGPR
jgi:glycosyltransferase involved in cell wall biosynthesis/GT2 family glycosyltransferase